MRDRHRLLLIWSALLGLVLPGCTALSSFDDFAARDGAPASDAGADAPTDSAPEQDGGSPDVSVDATDSGPEECPDDEMMCSEGCVDPLRDPSHCGGCDETCNGAVCNEGECIPLETLDLGNGSSTVTVRDLHVNGRLIYAGGQISPAPGISFNGQASPFLAALEQQDGGISENWSWRYEGRLDTQVTSVTTVGGSLFVAGMTTGITFPGGESISIEASRHAVFVAEVNTSNGDVIKVDHISANAEFTRPFLTAVGSDLVLAFSYSNLNSGLFRSDRQLVDPRRGTRPPAGRFFLTVLAYDDADLSTRPTERTTAPDLSIRARAMTSDGSLAYLVGDGNGILMAGPDSSLNLSGQAFVLSIAPEDGLFRQVRLLAPEPMFATDAVAGESGLFVSGLQYNATTRATQVGVARVPFDFAMTPAIHAAMFEGVENLGDVVPMGVSIHFGAPRVVGYARGTEYEATCGAQVFGAEFEDFNMEVTPTMQTPIRSFGSSTETTYTTATATLANGEQLVAAVQGTQGFVATRPAIPSCE